MNATETARHKTVASHTAQEQAAWTERHGYVAVVATPWFNVMLGVRAHGDVVTAIDFLSGNRALDSGRTTIARETVRQLRAYFKDPRYNFTLPLEPVGTPFQRRVWTAMREIPAGETRSYGVLARQLESGPRAIGGACRANPIPLIIPCHRVVASRGVGGFMGVTSGRGLQLKQRLLAHEGVA